MMLNPNGFSKDLRLLASSEFQAVFAGAERKAQTKEVLLLALKRESKEFDPRLGLVIGKKNAKKAVHRNLFKRVVRESFRLHKQSLIGYDFVVLARSGITGLSKHDLRSAMDALWGKLKPNHRPRLKNKA
jgi:ribonuclease P protein component